MLKSYTLIDSQKELDSLVDRLAESRVVALDTEFKRTNTYWPKLGLIQVGLDDLPLLLDPLNGALCYKRFFTQLNNPSLLKVLHAPYEDIEVLMPYLGAHLAPIFDTQTASVLCGLGENIGYERLVNSFLGVEIQKTCQRSEWLHRPLSKLQLEYAAQDVLYLIPIFQELEKRLRELGRHSWYEEEIQNQFGPGFLEEKKGRLPKRLGFNTKNPEVKHHLWEIASEACLWREEEAQRRNLPRKWVLSDQELTCLIESRDLDFIRLSQVPALRRLLKEETLQQTHELFRSFSGRSLSPKKSLSSDDQNRLDSLKAFLYKESQAVDLPPSFIAKSEDLVEVLYPLSGQTIPKILKGWRKEVFGDKALLFLSQQSISTEPTNSLT